MHNLIHLSTNLGRGGVSVLTLSGSNAAISEADKSVSTLSKREQCLKPGELVYGIVRDRRTGSIIDEVVIAAYSDTARIITGHGGSASALALLKFYLDLGFNETDSLPLMKDLPTEISFLNSMLAEAKTERQAITCLKAIRRIKAGDSPCMEEVMNIMRPRTVVLAGAPNAGKSSLLNLLCGYERVLVSDIAGTTRDAVRDYINLGGYFTHIIDTAGFRDEASVSEKEAIRRSREIINTADVILLVLDGSREISSDDRTALEVSLMNEKKAVIPVINKRDLPQIIQPQAFAEQFSLQTPVSLSCTTKEGIETLIGVIVRLLDQNHDG